MAEHKVQLRLTVTSVSDSITLQWETPLVQLYVSL